MSSVEEASRRLVDALAAVAARHGTLVEAADAAATLRPRTEDVLDAAAERIEASDLDPATRAEVSRLLRLLRASGLFAPRR